MRPNDFQYEWTVSSFDELTRIDKFVSAGFEEFSRTLVQKMISEEYIVCNHQKVKPNYQVKVGDLIQIEELPITLQDALPENIPLEIVYEDDDLLVVNKPSGMVVHPAPGHYTGTLVNALLYHIDHLSSGSEEERPGIVHRIDKDTSGLLMVAKNDFSHRALSEELKDKTTKREYVAIVDGVILNQMGSINAPIGRSRTDRKKMTVVEDGKEAKTHFEVLERFEKATLVACRLETGRTHQIRVHMAYINFPLLGDPVYGKTRHVASTGQYLHAKSLGFTHPRTKKWMEFDSLLPDYFIQKIEELRNR
ncbi:MAG: RluA family pseudouridine synthase [Firmicutes bacterium]|nr:RluA family pseudouridine synthase [Bacillota bacterium]